MTEQATPPAPAEATGIAEFNPEALGYEVGDMLAMPTLNLPEGVTRGIEFLCEMFEGQDISEKTGKPKRQPAILTRVRELSTGQEFNMVVPAIIVGELERHYCDVTDKDGVRTVEGHRYVGKPFAIQKSHQRAGKAYFDYRFAELRKGAS